MAAERFITHSTLEASPEFVAIKFMGTPEHSNVSALLCALQPYLNYSQCSLVIVFELNRVSSSWAREVAFLNQCMKTANRRLSVVIEGTDPNQHVGGAKRFASALAYVSPEVPIEILQTWQEALPVTAPDVQILPFAASSAPAAFVAATGN